MTGHPFGDAFVNGGAGGDVRLAIEKYTPLTVGSVAEITTRELPNTTAIMLLSGQINYVYVYDPINTYPVNPSPAPGDSPIHSSDGRPYVLSGVSNRELLTANRTYYVAATGGSDINSGLSAGSPLVTIQAAINKCYKLDSNGYTVTIQLADGTYHESPLIDRTIVGGARLTIAGNAVSPGNVIWYPATYYALRCLGGSKVRVRDIHMQMDNTWSCVQVGEVSDLYIGNLLFGPALNRSHIEANRNSVVTIENNYSIAGGAQRHLSFETGATLVSVSKTITITGTPAFSTAFAVFSGGANYSPFSTTWSGAATGKRYDVSYNAVCRGGAATHFPGDVAGTTATGGQYGY